MTSNFLVKLNEEAQKRLNIHFLFIPMLIFLMDITQTNDLETNRSIIFFVILGFLIVFSLFVTAQYIILNNFLVDERDEIYLKTLNEIREESDETINKIFLIGSSHVRQLNTTHIQQIISSEYPNYKVYDLAVGSDNPKQRLKLLNDLVDVKPEIVFYGIGFRDFQSFAPVSENVKPESFLPDPKEFFEMAYFSFEKSTEQDMDFLESPKVMTLKFYRKIMGDEFQKNVLAQDIDENKTPQRFPRDVILSLNELKADDLFLPQAKYKIKPLNINKKFDSLIEIIKILQEKNIKLIIFTTPHTSFYLENLSESNKNLFEEAINEISQLNVKVYRFHDKYTQLDIWSDNTHIAKNPNALIFSEDIAGIALQEIKS